MNFEQEKIRLLWAGEWPLWQTAGLAFGGANNSPYSVYTNTEEYDGSSWTAGGALGTARYGMAPAQNGTQTAALSAGGAPGATAITATEGYDGSSWSTLANLGTGTYRLAGAGIQTAGLAFGGGPAPSVKNTTQEFTGANIAQIEDIDVT